VDLERGPLSLVSVTEELLGRNSSGSGRERREYGSGDPLRLPRDILYPQEMALTSPTSGGLRPRSLFYLLFSSSELLPFFRRLFSFSCMQRSVSIHCYPVVACPSLLYMLVQYTGIQVYSASTLIYRLVHSSPLQ
jgi:hypothetical protein